MQAIEISFPSPLDRCRETKKNWSPPPVGGPCVYACEWQKRWKYASSMLLENKQSQYSDDMDHFSFWSFLELPPPRKHQPSNVSTTTLDGKILDVYQKEGLIHINLKMGTLLPVLQYHIFSMLFLLSLRREMLSMKERKSLGIRIRL